jgi:hypothetical protein
MSTRPSILVVAAIFNLASLLSLAQLARLPDASLWLRNALFAQPKPLREMERLVIRPPSLPLAASMPSTGLPSVEKVRELCARHGPACAPKTLAAALATRKRSGGCGSFRGQSQLVSGVLAGGGCCSDVVKTFLLLSRELGFTSREVHIPSHTTAEVWDSVGQRWIWIDPFMGYQAFAGDRALSHMEIYQRFSSGLPVQFVPIQSAWPLPILSAPNYQGHRPASYGFLFYTPADSLDRSARLSDWLGGTPLPRPLRESLLYLTVKPPLLATAAGFNFFLLVMARYALLAWVLAWFSSTLLVLVLMTSRRQTSLASTKQSATTT